MFDIAFAGDGTAYVATAGGLSILKQKKMTLAEKAEHYERLVRERHVRPPGLVEHCILKKPGDLSSHAPTDTDNDGLFTGLYVGAESFRYAVTGDPEAAKNAREGYRAMEFLQTVTDTPGFVARTVIPSDWGHMADRNRTFTPQQVAAEAIQNPRFKRVENRWRKSADGKWIWKGDTSSDEISGHYFAYGVYYDLVADEQERRRVAELVRRITDYIIDGGYTLRDIDGEPTLWGVWAPDRLLDDPNWQPERGSNSVEILSFLAVAHHVTGDEKYEREIARLFDEKRFSELILSAQAFGPLRIHVHRRSAVGPELSRAVGLRSRSEAARGLSREPAAVVRRGSPRPQPVVCVRLRRRDGWRCRRGGLRRILARFAARHGGLDRRQP